jgi:polyisoprenoid-binding protein YceI
MFKHYFCRVIEHNTSFNGLVSNKPHLNYFKSMKNLSLMSVLFAATALVMVSCTGNPKSDEAEVGEAQEVAVFEGANTLAMELSQSQLTWIGTKPTGRHNGTISIAEGTLNITDDAIVGGKIVFDLNNIVALDLVENEDMHNKLVNHLKSADFFDIENHPTAIFEITGAEAIAAEEEVAGEESEFKISNPTHKISGNLTMRGTTLGISFPARVSIEGGQVKAEAKFNIDRTKWGVSYGDESKVADKAKDSFIYNTVNIGFDIVAAQALAVAE